MLRRKPRKRSGMGGGKTLSLLTKSVGGNQKLDDDIQRKIDEAEKINSEQGGCFARFRQQGRHICHNNLVLYCVVILCMVDCVLVIGELILDMHAVKGMVDVHPSYEKNKSTDNFGMTQVEYYYDYEGGVGDVLPVQPYEKNNSTKNLRLKQVEYDYNYDAGVGDILPVHKVHHKKHKKHSIEEKIAHKFHYASISILVILFVETVIKIICFGSYFLKKKFEVFDAFVVALSLILDLVFIQGTTSRSIQESAYILSFLLPWRVIRVVNSMIVALFDHEHIKLTLMFKSKKTLSRLIDELSADMVMLQKQLGALKQLTVDYNISDAQIDATKEMLFQNDPKRKSLLNALAVTSVRKTPDGPSQNTESNTNKNHVDNANRHQGGDDVVLDMNHLDRVIYSVSRDSVSTVTSLTEDEVSEEDELFIDAKSHITHASYNPAHNPKTLTPIDTIYDEEF